MESAEEALSAYFRRMDGGEDVDRKRFLDEYPDLAEDLRSFWATTDALKQLLGDISRRQEPGA